MNRFTAVVFTVVLTVSSLSGIAMAQDAAIPAPNSAANEMMDKIGLSADQKKQLETMQQTQMQEAQALYQQLMTTGSQLQEELIKSTLDLDKVNKLNSEYKNIQGQISDKGIASMVALRKVFTQEQFDKFIGLSKEEEQKFRSRAAAAQAAPPAEPAAK